MSSTNIPAAEQTQRGFLIGQTVYYAQYKNNKQNLNGFTIRVRECYFEGSRQAWQPGSAAEPLVTLREPHGEPPIGSVPISLVHSTYDEAFSYAEGRLQAKCDELQAMIETLRSQRAARKFGNPIS